MAQEFTINSSAIESKINQLLPSQGGFGAGVDFSASTMVIPIVDLTESAEGSGLRQDLQTALKFQTTVFNINNATNTVIINTTGYYRIFGLMSLQDVTASSLLNFNLFDGTTTKILLDGKQGTNFSSVGVATPISLDFIVKIQAGESLRGSANGSGIRLNGTATQIADINGNLS